MSRYRFDHSRGVRECSVLALILGAPLVSMAQSLPPVPFPSENQFSEAKRVLGKVLFWDEQLSSDNTTACGTCHIPASAGGDPRTDVNPGFDGNFGTPDDVFGSPGLITTDQNDDYQPSLVFQLRPQVTGRTAQPSLTAMFADDLFWDGRARSQFVDPENGQVAIATGGGLESQAVGPIVSDVEMAHASRDWAAVSSKLETARPLALATNLPGDVSSAIALHGSYPELFEEAFGDGAISARRIAFAIATYERTLVPDQTDWDAFVQGDGGALTQQQQRGLGAFNGPGRCAACHTPPVFSDGTFRNIGLRPVQEDLGRQIVTGSNADRGKFKVPTLRNAGLKTNFMHNGQFTQLPQVLAFYARGPGTVQFPDNRDPLMQQINLPPPVAADIAAFIAGGLTDPRVANETFPFDRPSLHSELGTPNPRLINQGVAGSGGIVPRMIAITPPNLGNEGFKVGVERGLGGASARVALSSSPPQGGRVPLDRVLGPFTLGGSGAGDGHATCHWPVPSDGSLDGNVMYMQWIIDDPSAPSGEALSRVAEVALFCGTGDCEPACLADWNDDGTTDTSDFLAFLNDYNAVRSGGTPLMHSPDLAVPFGTVSTNDFLAYLNLFSIGCP